MPTTVPPSPIKAGRITLVVIALIALLLVFYGRNLVPRIWEMNAMLREDPVLAAYPYEFRVVNFLNGIAAVTRPYTDALGPKLFLTHIQPALAGLGSDDPAMHSAEQALKEHEYRAIQLLLDQPDVDSVIWYLDQAWYTRNKVALPAELAIQPRL
jgi:hypothetical protein